METGFISSCQVTVQLIRPPAAPLFHLSLGKLSLKKQEHIYSMNHAHDDIISVYLSLSLSFLSNFYEPSNRNKSGSCKICHYI